MLVNTQQNILGHFLYCLLVNKLSNKKRKNKINLNKKSLNNKMDSEDVDVVSTLDDGTADQLEPMEDHTQDELLNDSLHAEDTENHAQDLSDETNTAAPQVEEKREKLIQLPMAKVKSIIKSDPDVNMVNLEAVFIIAKSTVIYFFFLQISLYCIFFCSPGNVYRLTGERII